jgi:hypothetical protein
MASDRARLSYDPNRKWRGLIAQQGRVTLEADWNEAAAIDDERDRLLTLDFVGPIGTPNSPAAGYVVTGVPQANAPAASVPGDLTIGAGALYVGGERFDLDAPVTYSTQAEWLDSSTDPLWVTPPGVPVPPGRTVVAFELVYLLAFAQEVSAVEDPELADVALGGPDTMQRRRLIQHFVRQTIADATDDWWSQLTAAAPAGAFAGVALDTTLMRLFSRTRLQVAFAGGASGAGGVSAGAGAAAASGAAGYLGAENQLIRVQVASLDSSGTPTIVWGFDNGSNLYRVTATYDASTNTTALTLATPPVDPYHYPVAGQAVELLRDAMQLSPTDYVAASTGFVTSVTTAYDPTTMTLVIEGGPPGDFLPPTPSTGPAGPQVKSLTPAVGTTSGGTPVTVTGSGFTGATQVNFGPNNPGSGLLVQSDTQLTVASPAAAAGAVEVTVVTPLGTSPAGPQFTYTQPSAPTVTAVSPPSGVLGGGTLVTVTGTGFTGTTTTNFGANPGIGLVIEDDSHLSVFSPPGAAGAVDVNVVTPLGTSPTGVQFTYEQSPPPQVTGISPANGGLRGGTVVTVTGSGFTGATAVDFGSEPGTGLSVLSDTELTVTSPAAPNGASGPVDVTVTTPAGTSPAIAADEFTYQLQVTGVFPTSGPPSGGTVVTVSGNGFTGATAVNFGASAGTGLTVQSDTQLTVTSPPGGGTVDITVITAEATSTPNPHDRFGYEATPQLYLRVWQNTAAPATVATAPAAILSRVPRPLEPTPLHVVPGLKSGLAQLQPSKTATYVLDGTGVEVTLTSDNGSFHVGDYWSFAVRPSAPTSVYPARYLTGGQPPDGPQTWICPLAIVTWAVDGSATAASQVPQFWNLVTLTNAVLTNVKLPTPVVTGVSPATGPPSGGTLVTVTGTGFTGASTVYFGPDSNPGTGLSVEDDTQLTVVSPAGSGAVDLRVVTAGGVSVVGAEDRFGYVGVTGVSPAIGAPTGGDVVTITGSGFTGATGVNFGSEAGTGVSVVSDTEITVTSPAGSGLVNITLITPLGPSPSSAAAQFAWAQTNAVNPSSGPQGGGTVVTVTGLGFQAAGASQVDFGPVAASGFSVQSDTQLMATAPAGNGAVPVTVLTRLGQAPGAPTFTYVGKAQSKDIKDISDKANRDKPVIQDKAPTRDKTAIADKAIRAALEKITDQPVKVITDRPLGAAKSAEAKPPETGQLAGELSPGADEPSPEEAEGQAFIKSEERPEVGREIIEEE